MAPYIAFKIGCHSNCSPDFCKTKRQQCNSSRPPNNTDTVTTTTKEINMTENSDNTTNKDTTDSTITDSDTTTDNDACTITNDGAINNTVTDDDTVINAGVRGDTMNSLVAGNLIKHKIMVLQYNNTLDIHDVMIEQQQAATNNEGLDDIRSTSATAVEVDQSMIFDIQRVVSRFVAKRRHN